MAIDTVKHNNIDTIKLISQCWQEINEGEKRMGHVNIIIAGKTGVGKSTLINAAFRDNLAETGMGMPVTQETQLIEKEGLPLRIYDSVGLELTEKTKQATIDNIHELIQEKFYTNNPDEYIHCMWYCVQANSDRLEKPEQEFIADIAKKIPVVLVITKSFLKNQAKKFATVLNKYRLEVKNICIVLAQSCDDEDIKVEAYGVENLLKVTLDILPQSAQDAFINAQSSAEIKNRQAIEIVNQTVAMAFGASFIPVPVADIAMLIPTEISMMTRIANIYGLKMTRDKIKRIFFIMFSALGAASAGAFFAKGLLKIVPGVGTLAGGAISGAAAGAMTQAFGRTYIFIMNKLYTGEMTEEDLQTVAGREQIKNVIRGETANKKIDENFKNISRDMLSNNKPRKSIFNIIGDLFGKK